MLAVYFAVLVLIYIGVYYRSCRAGADCKDATVITFLAILLGGVSIGPRMLLFGWLCMVGLLLVMDRFQRTGKGLWLLPPLFALWINLHGSWVFGLVVLAMIIALRPGGRGVGTGGGATVEFRGAKKLLLALGGFVGGAVCQPLWLQAGAVPVESIFFSASTT